MRKKGVEETQNKKNEDDILEDEIQEEENRERVKKTKLINNFYTENNNNNMNNIYEVTSPTSTTSTPFHFPMQSQLTNNSYPPLSPSPQSTIPIKKMGFFQSFASSKKNSILSNISIGMNNNNHSSQGFRQTHTTNYTDRNDTIEQNNFYLESNHQTTSQSSQRRIKTDRIKQNVKKQQGLKFQEVIHENGILKNKISQQQQQPSLQLIMNTQQQLQQNNKQKNSQYNLNQKKKPIINIPTQKSIGSQFQSQTTPVNESSSSFSQKLQKSKKKINLQNLLSKQTMSISNNHLFTGKTLQPLTIQKIVSEINSKKTPFSNICKQIFTNMQHLQKKIKSKVQFFNHFSKILQNKSHYLQGIFLIHELQEVLQDPNQIDKALVQVINSAEFRSSSQAQRGMIKNLILELNILNKEIFDVYLLQSKQEISNMCERILYEREEVEYLTSRLQSKHYPNFQKKATLFNIFSHHSMPVTYNKEKYDCMEERFGKFNLISHENRFICSEIEKVVCNLKDINYINNNPYRNTIS